MSVLIYDKPKELDLAGNKLFVRLKGTGYLISEGVKAYITILPNGAPADGNSFSLSFINSTHNFYFSTEDPLPLPPSGYDWVLPAVDDLYAVADAMNGYPALTTYYTVQSDGAALIVQAKEEGNYYNITGDVSNTPNYTIFNEVGGEERLVREDYHIKALISLENMSEKGTYIQIPAFRIYPDSEQIGVIEIGEILRRRFLQFFDLPDFNMTGVVKAKVATMAYSLNFQEMSGDTVLSSATMSPQKVIKGKVNASDHPGFDLRSWLNGNKKFLTNAPERIYTYISAKEYLFWLNPLSGTLSIKVKISASTSSASIPAVDILTAAMDVSQDEVLIIPVTDMLRNAPGGDKSIECSVSVITAANGITLAGVQNYLFRPQRLYSRAFIFQNRLGGFGTIIAQSQKNILRTNKTSDRRALTPGYSPYIGDMSYDASSVEDTFTAYTGPVTAAMAAQVKELAESDAVFLQSDDRFVRLWIDKGSFSITKEPDNLHNVSFRYRPAFTGDHISAAVALPQGEHKDYSLEYLKSDYQ